MKRLLALCAVLLAVWSAQAGPSYKITLQIDGNTDSAMIMGYYYADRYAPIDTATNNGHGRFVFQGNRELEPGLYFFTNNRGRHVDFVVYHEKPRFEFRTADQNWSKSMTVKGSKENEVFFNYLRQNAALYDEISASSRGLDSAARAAFEAQQAVRYDSVKNRLMSDYPRTMAARMIGATLEEPIPLLGPSGDTLSPAERWRWLADHYWDHVPLADDFVIRTPKNVFYDRLTFYVDNVLKGLPPEMLCPLLDTLIDRAEPAPSLFRYLVITLTEKYLQSNIMVYDEVYCHLALRYYGAGKAVWASPSTIDEVVERAHKWEHLLVGRESPELILFDTLHRPFSLHRMPGDYTLLAFWSPTCGHCREIIPAVYRVFEEYADTLNLTAFTILTEPDEETTHKWKKFMVEHGMTNRRWVSLGGGEANVDWREVYDVTTTPQIFLIENKEHKFVAKKMNADILRTVCRALMSTKER